MLEIVCKKCKNCNENSCEVYGSNANKTVDNCASDGFENYIVSETHNAIVTVDKDI